MVNKEKYELKRKEYNSDKTFVQISKELHKKIKEHCKENGLKIKDFLEEVISKSIS
jgi:predicted DNA binding CopG/RHH family protein